MQHEPVRLAETRIHGHKVAYRVAGDPALPVLVLIHGITSSSTTWDPVIPALAEHAHVIAPDLYGHGASYAPHADYSLGGFATQVRDLMDTLGHDHATIVGHSLGGGVAMQFAYQYFDHCERLVLVDSGGFGREVSIALRAGTMPGVELVLPLVANRHVRNAGLAASRLLSRMPVRRRPRPSTLEVARGYSTLAESPSRTAFVHTLRSVVEPGGQRVSAIDRLYVGAGRPTLIIWGACDTVIPVAHAYHAHEAIPGSQLEIFEQSEHFPHMDEPSRFARVLHEFLTSTQPMHLDRATMRERMAQRTREHHEAGEREAAARLAREAAELEIAGSGLAGSETEDPGREGGVESRPTDA
jgi:pimeloyl-ACP methyl ester carboxylesterase